MKTIQPLRIHNFHGKHVVQIPAHRGEEVFLLLALQGIETTVVRKPGSRLASLEMDQDVNVEAVQAILNEWHAACS